MEVEKVRVSQKRSGSQIQKATRFGIYQRDGKIYLELIPDAQQPILEKIIRKMVEKGGEVFSDRHTGYSGLVGLGYVHRTINHEKEEYTNGRIHINGMEGFWGLSKTNMFSYKGIRKKNWNEYLKEMAFRYNYRGLDYDNLVLKVIEVLCQKID